MSQPYKPLFCTILLILISDIGHTQSPSRDVQLATARELIQMGREEIITEDMRFTSEEAEAFWPLYNEYRERLAVVQDRYVVLIVDYVGGYYDYKLTDADAEKILDEYFEIQNDILKIREKYVRKFGKIMSSSNVMRLYQIENKIEAEVNSALALTVPLMESK